MNETGEIINGEFTIPSQEEAGEMITQDDLELPEGKITRGSRFASHDKAKERRASGDSFNQREELE